MRALLLVALLLCELLLRGSIAHADERQVLFAMIDSAPALPKEVTTRALAGQFAGFGIEVVVISVAQRGSLREQADELAPKVQQAAAIAGFWLEADGDEVLLYLIEPAAERILVRRIARQDDAVTAESVAIVARSSADALSRGGKIGMTEVPLPSSPPADDTSASEPISQPPPVTPSTLPADKTMPAPIATARAAQPPPPRSRPLPDAASARTKRSDGLGVEAGYLGTLFSDALPWTHGIGFGGYWQASRWSIGAAGSVFPSASVTLQPQPTSSRGREVTIELSRWRGEIVGGYRFAFDSDFFAALRWGLFSGALSRRTIDVAGLVPTEPARSFVIGTYALGVVGVSAADGAVDVSLRLGPEVPFNAADFAVGAMVVDTLVPVRLRTEAALTLRP